MKKKLKIFLADQLWKLFSVTLTFETALIVSMYSNGVLKSVLQNHFPFPNVPKVSVVWAKDIVGLLLIVD